MIIFYIKDIDQDQIEKIIGIKFITNLCKFASDSTYLIGSNALSEDKKQCRESFIDPYDNDIKMNMHYQITCYNDENNKIIDYNLYLL